MLHARRASLSHRLARVVQVGLAAGLLSGATACEQPDSIELGAVCKGSAECKDPADTCLTIGTQSKCSMACSKDKHCPEGYACPVTDPAKKTVGMCLPQADVSKSTVMVY